MNSSQGTEEGSFGDCRKQERMAAKFGNKCKKACPGDIYGDHYDGDYNDDGHLTFRDI